MTSAPEPALRAVLVDDSGIFRRGLRLLLETVGVDVVEDVGDAAPLAAVVAARSPDVVVLDVRLPPTHTDEGLRAAIALRASHPTVGLLVLSTYAETRLVMQLLDAVPSGVGYLLKDRVADAGELLAALRRVARGGIAVDGEVVAQLMHSRRAANPLDALTTREREVLALLAEGRSNPGVAAVLHLSVKTVEGHIAAIFRQLGLTDEGSDNRRVKAALAYLAARP